MKIVIMIEGKTEQAFLPALRGYIKKRLNGSTPRLQAAPYDARLPKGETLKRDVQRHLGIVAPGHQKPRNPADAVIALTDVYTGSNDFTDAADAKAKMSEWVGEEPRFYPHAAQYEFEAWLFPYWDVLCKKAGLKKAPKPPAKNPETVNHQNPPSKRIKTLIKSGERCREYSKPIFVAAVLRDADLSLAIDACPELKALVNTILTLCGAQAIP